GFAHQLYTDIGGRYGVDRAYNFTPDVAQGVVDGYLTNAGVPVVRSTALAQLRYRTGWWEATTVQGRVIQARYVIDATYEGDLLALAGIGFRLGREGRSEFGEPDAGIGAPSHGDATVDPHVVPRDPASGLLPGVETMEYPTIIGAADRRVMAACFRLTLTSDSRRLAWSAPVGYDRSVYEISGRVAIAGGNPLKNLHPIVNGQQRAADLNNYQMGSTDLISQGGRAWIEADASARTRLFDGYRDWTQRLLYFLASDPSVPPAVQQVAKSWGLDPNQYPSHAGWSPLLYVREGRRMIGRETLTELEVLVQQPVTQPVALASYPMDAHDYRYLVDSRGRLAVEGDLSIPHPPVGVPMGALIPATAPPGFVSAVGISTSHVAWCAVRTEPVFAMIGQAAGVLVASAHQQGVTPATVPYASVRQALIARGAVLGQ
ncbi:MAG TPA: FAD-dependent oxidoreductase, partial [Acidimicrobiales bacterium]|nr:FAD-dependent oxidoreductase [Acidimicrobiales bacterium]